MKIVVLDYTVGEVIIKDVPSELEELDGEYILTGMDFDIDNTAYMVVDDELPITIDTKGIASKMTLK